MQLFLSYIAGALLAALTLTARDAAIDRTGEVQRLQPESHAQAYRSIEGLTGTVTAICSEETAALMRQWVDGFMKYYPGSIDIHIEQHFQFLVPSVMIDSRAQIGVMLRQLDAAELGRFQETFGSKPVSLRSAVETLVVIVHKDNPIPGLALPQLDALFSTTRLGGFPEDITRWRQLGLDVDWEVKLVGDRFSGLFRKRVVLDGDFADMEHVRDPKSVIKRVAGSRQSIGFCGLHHINSSVREIALAKQEGEPFRDSSLENLIDGTYPLGRSLYIYINRPPDMPSNPLVSEFGKFVLSGEGQTLAMKSEYVPLPQAVIEQQLAKLD